MPDNRRENEPGVPIAIVGMGCHFPGGATDPAKFWDLLCKGVDATRDVPGDRWEPTKFYDPQAVKSGKMRTFHGGYLDRIDQFDAHFFGISPREAIWLDPQQRLLMQVTWEALEDAGQIPRELRGSDTGVFIGGFTLDYQLLQNYGVLSRYELQANSATGMMMTMLANRLSYAFDFRGPSMAVDTACSASLVAVHLAIQSIWNGDCSLAIAGGANVMIAPNMTIAESKGGFLSPEGRCKTFDATADGYARGEGAGVLLLKPLPHALADGDPVYALIRGTAVTQDGHTVGITVPNQAAQEAAMRSAYRRAGVPPHAVQYVEAHGTGTPVGDPIEARAIGGVVSKDRPDGTYCLVGSVKTNIGHLEAAAGVAGLIKAALALKHGAIPPHLNLSEPNPDIPFDALRLRVPTELTDWPAGDGEGRRYAGVNSFGFGGTNAHVVLEEAPAIPEARSDLTARTRHAGPYPLPISARSPEALAAAARSFREFLVTREHPLPDIGYSASLRREHHDHRLAVVAASAEEAVQRLDAFLDSTDDTGTAVGRVPSTGRPRIAFVCSGMGPQWWAMGRELFEREPVFRAAVQRCDAELRRWTGWSLVDALLAPEEESRMEETEVAQTTNFALQVALAELWRSWGIEPDAVVGHSTGEVAAQYLAGALSFEDAVKVNYYRSSLQQRTTGAGRMLAVGMTPETLSQAVRDAGPRVSVAAINSPSSVTLAGDAAVLEDMARQLNDFGVFHRFLTVKVPYHSPYMDQIRDDLLTGLADLAPRAADIPLYSTVTGTQIDGSGIDANYWWRNVRGTVLFAAAFSQMIADGYTVFVELSPHPVLASSMRELLAAEGRDGVVVPSLRRMEPELPVMLRSLGALYAHGAEVNWRAWYGDVHTFVRLPRYQWQLSSYWAESREAREDRLYSPVHPLLGQRIGAVHPTWELEINSHRLPYLADHRVQQNVVVPAAAFIEMALAAADQVFGADLIALESVSFRAALVLTDSADPRLRTTLRQDEGLVEIASYNPTAGEEARWTVHATARLSPRNARGAAPDLAAMRRECPRVIDRDECHERTAGMGFQYGPAFRAIEHIDAGDGSAVGRLETPAVLDDDLSAYRFHPSLLDAAFQVLLIAAGPATPDAPQAPYLPVGIDRLRVLGRPVPGMRVAVRVRRADERSVLSDISIVSPAGDLLVEIEGFRAQSLAAVLGLSPEHLDRSLYELEWQEPPPAAAEDGDGETPAPEPGCWLVFTDRQGVGERLRESLTALGGRAVTVAYDSVLEVVEEAGNYVINPAAPQHFELLVARLAEREQVTNVVHLWSLDAANADTTSPSSLWADQRRGLLSVVHLTKALAQASWESRPRVWLVTRGAQPVGPDDGPLAVAQAPVWGLGRVIGHQEFASSWGGLVDLDPRTGPDQAALLAAEILRRDAEDQIAFRDGRRHVARLVPSRRLTRPLPWSVRADGSYLVTGGLGSLGLLAARELVQGGARHLVLVARTPLPPRSSWRSLDPEHPRREVVARLLELEAMGATIHLAGFDVSQEDQLREWLDAYEREARPPIRGVMHCAGVVKDELLLRTDTETFERVLAPKVIGGWSLHRVLADHPLDFFVLFSSTGSVIASAGQGSYAAGNAFLDALAHHRRALGMPALSICWGPWSIGMVEELQLQQFYLRRGIELITPEAGTAILRRVVGQPPAQVVAITVDWATARETSPLGAMPPMFSLVGIRETDGAGQGADPDAGSVLRHLAEVSEQERPVVVSAHLQELAARVLQLDAARVTEQDSLTSLGMDSMMAIEVKQRIEAALQVDVSVLELLQGATIAELAGRILASLHVDDVAPVTQTADVTAEDSDPSEASEGAQDPADDQLAEIERLLITLPQADLDDLLNQLERKTP